MESKTVAIMDGNGNLVITRVSYNATSDIETAVAQECAMRAIDFNNCQWQEITTIRMPETGHFPITSVARADLEEAGYDASNVTDETMQRIAKMMHDGYLADMFAADLEDIADDLGIPKRAEE